MWSTSVAVVGRPRSPSRQRVGPGGRVLGVDISEPMLARAQDRCAALGLANVELLRADASACLSREATNSAFSCFGIMFFEDPAAAIENIGRGLHTGGRLAFVCWQERARNPWMGIPMSAVLQHVPPPPPLSPDAPGPWAFADPDRVSGLLDAAGFGDIAIESLEHELLVGGASSLDGAVAYSIDSGSVRSVLGDVDDDTRRRVADSIRVAFEPYAGPDGVRIASAAWVVSARWVAS